jgi:Zn-dependent metalloprotease
MHHLHDGSACIHCIIAPYVIEHMAKHKDAAIRKLAMEVIESAAEARAMRTMMATMPSMAAIPSPGSRKHRLIYNLNNKGMSDLPGTLMREEGKPWKKKDKAGEEAYRHAGYVYDFYKKIFGRNSMNDNGMSLISSVHLGRNHNNAYWNGEQMIYGDGDGRRFIRFTKALDVVGHEFSHAVVTHTCNLEYRNESGALNEHFADVMGVLVEQWKAKHEAKDAQWTIGKDCLGPDVNATGLRTFKAEKAYENDPIMGTDQQPKHISNKYTGLADRGGVHINSGIPNHAFYVTALALGGHAWERAGLIWYKTLNRLHSLSDFMEMVQATRAVASDEYGPGSAEAQAVDEGWTAVGLM